MVVVNLIQNATLLVTLVVAHKVLLHRFSKTSYWYQFLTGFLFGGMGIAAMMTSIQLAPGIIFDGRSIILSVGGILGGPIVAGVAAVICSVYRFGLGGEGVWVGTGVIVGSAVLGTGYYYWRQHDERLKNALVLWGFGLLVEACMMVMMLALPHDIGRELLVKVAPPILLIFPIAIMLVSRILMDYEFFSLDKHRIQEAEFFLHMLIDSIPIPIFYKDKEGRYLGFNRAFEIFFGKTRKELIGKTVFDIHPQNLAEIYQTKDNELFERGGDQEYESQIKNARGELRDVVFNKSVFTDSQGIPRGLIGVVRDISEQKQTRQTLTRNERLYREAIGVAGAFPYYQNYLTNEYEFVGDGIEALFGCRPGEFTPQYFQSLEKEIELTGELEGLPYDAAIKKARSTEGVSWTANYKIKTEQGQERWIANSAIQVRDDEGKIIGSLGIFEDISEQKQAEDALRQRNEMIETILNNIPVMIALHDKDGYHNFVNRCWEKTLGWTNSEAQNLDFLALCYPDAKYRQIVLDIINSANGEWHDFKTHTRDGRVLDTSWANVRLKDGSMIGIGLDITKRKQTEENLCEADLRLQQAVKSGNVGLWDWDLKTNKVHYSAEWKSQIGYEEHEIGDDYKEWESRVHPDDLEPTLKEVKKTIAETHVEHQTEFRFRHKDGSWRWILVQASVIKDDSGQAVRMLGSHVDITDVKRAEEEIESLARFPAENPNPVIRADKKGTVLYSNESGEHVLRIWNCGPNQVLPDDVQDQITETLKADTSLLKDVQCDDRFYALQVVPISGMDYVNIYGQDITERRAAMQALHESEKRFRELFENMSNGVAIYERVNDGQDFIFKEINPAGANIGRLKREDHIGRSVLEVYPGIKEMGLFAVFQEVWRTGASQHLDITRYKDKRVSHWVDNYIYKLPTGEIVAIFEDVTKQHQAEQDRERQMSAIEQAAEAIMITDVEANIQYVNPAFERITGYTCEEVIGQNPRFLQSGEHDQTFYRGMWDMLLRGETWSGRMVNKRKDGALFTEDATISPVQDTQGRTINYVGVKHDITEQLELEQQYRQAQKMESIGRLAGGVAHDFNNMLQVVLGNAELAIRELPKESPLRDSLIEIERAAERSAVLTQRLLGFARKQTARPRVMDLNESILGILDMLHRLISEEIDLVWKPGSELWSVHLDPTQLDQILANLLVNAHDAIGGVGSVTVETANKTIDEAYCSYHQGFAPGEYAMLAVSDNGCGMDKETLAHIFEPFYTTKEMGKGTGLGLATIYGIVKQNGGFINVYSEPGQGTTFKIYLPRSQDETVEPEKPQLEAPIRSTGETVLIVEDDEAALRLSKWMLEELGHTVITANTPGKALQLAKQHEGAIHLLLTDVVMPEMNGQELFKRLHSDCPEMKCLYMSGYTANIIAHDGILDPRVCFLSKPFSLLELGLKVREALEPESSD